MDSIFSQLNVALRGPTGTPQSPAETITRLSDRLSQATQISDRRSTVLTLKGLSRDWKAEVGQQALPGLVDVLINDADLDEDIGKAVLETLYVLCNVNEEVEGGRGQGHPHIPPNVNKELGFKHTDVLLADERVTHKMFALLAHESYLLRLGVLELLMILLPNRRQVIQSYFLKAPVGATAIIAVLEEKRERIRDEALIMLQTLVHQSPDIQKVLAFEGAFERLFGIVRAERGLDGGLVVHDALACVDALLRFNSSNQSYFRETMLPPMLPALLLFPPTLKPDQPVPQDFALQFWDSPHKPANASLVVGIVGMLVNSKGGSLDEIRTFSRCLVEIGLASNAPTFLKTQALRLLPTNLGIPLPSLVVTPYMPVPGTNDEEWDRLEPASALDALVELVLHGEYNGLFGEKRSKDGMELRAAALGVIQNFVSKDEIREAIVRAMLPAEGTNTPPPITPLLHALTAPPTSPLAIGTVTSTHFSCLLFSHLLRYSPRAKILARQIVPSTNPPPSAQPGDFFVPADGGPAPASPVPPPPEPEDDDDELQSLLQILSEHLSLAFLSRVRADTSDLEVREWDRLIVGYLSLLVQWLWDDPGSVKDFLQTGGLGMLVEPINQMADSDPVIPGLCALLLGICYEFNREPGEITRATIHPILTRLGIDTLIGRITRLRDDDRFKAIGPDTLVLSYPNQATSLPNIPGQHGHAGAPGAAAAQGALQESEKDREAEIWFDWAFVDFWKSNYYTVVKGVAVDPNEAPPTASQNAETEMLVTSLRTVISQQSDEILALRNQLAALQASSASATASRLEELQSDLKAMREAFEVADDRRKDMEKEQEDLFVLLDEMNVKRKKDKQRMREAGMDVSEDEDEEDDEE
ncbi:hypothetical protein QCA50_005333 [Cerrena zonata]|uniref:General vesicular transport factor p115 n=1 Tax=Cerrena zonata TaxID=2478898 RepID=A0AAW0GEK5_9APHY